jgi:hypothetical protein
VREGSDVSGVVWTNASGFFERRAVARVGPLTAEVFDVVGGSNADRNPFGWYVVRNGDEDVDDGAASTMDEAKRRAERAMREAV